MITIQMIFPVALAVGGLIFLFSGEDGESLPAEVQGGGGANEVEYWDRYFSQCANDLALDASDYWRTLARVFY